MYAVFRDLAVLHIHALCTLLSTTVCISSSISAISTPAPDEGQETKTLVSSLLRYADETPSQEVDALLTRRLIFAFFRTSLCTTAAAEVQY